MSDLDGDSATVEFPTDQSMATEDFTSGVGDIVEGLWTGATSVLGGALEVSGALLGGAGDLVGSLVDGADYPTPGEQSAWPDGGEGRGEESRAGNALPRSEDPVPDI